MSEDAKLPGARLPWTRFGTPDGDKHTWMLAFEDDGELVMSYHVVLVGSTPVELRRNFDHRRNIDGVADVAGVEAVVAKDLEAICVGWRRMDFPA